MYRKGITLTKSSTHFRRLCPIPLIMWLYIKKLDYFSTLIVLLLSGLTGIVDGIIARKCNMASDFGKIFESMTDKLTQIAMLFCLVFRFMLVVQEHERTL